MRKKSKIALAFAVISVIAFVLPKNAEAYRIYQPHKEWLCRGAQGNCLPDVVVYG